MEAFYVLRHHARMPKQITGRRTCIFLFCVVKCEENMRGALFSGPFARAFDLAPNAAPNAALNRAPCGGLNGALLGALDAVGTVGRCGPRLRT